MRISMQSGVFALVTGAALFAPTLALAWSKEASFLARVHKHEFTRATVESDGCVLKLRLFFEAPESA